MNSNFYIEYYKGGQLVRTDDKANNGNGYAPCYAGFDWGDVWEMVKDSTTIFTGNYIDALVKVAKSSDKTGFTRDAIDIVYDGSFDEIKVIFTGGSDDDLISNACGFDWQMYNLSATLYKTMKKAHCLRYPL